MVGKAKMTITGVSIANIVPIRASQIGHTFDLKATLKVSKRKAGALSGDGIDCPDLEWKETIEWFEQHADGTWHYKGKNQKDMYHHNPDSNTFKIWRDMRYVLASDDLNHPPEALKEALKSTADRDKAAKHWIAENGFEWTIPAAQDKPALGLNPGPGAGGGGGESLVTSNTRRRVIYFDLGFKGSSMRATATQILETVNGEPTIIQFFHPAISKADADNVNKLASWRI